MNIKTKIRNVLDKRNLYSTYDDFDLIDGLSEKLNEFSKNELNELSDDRVWSSNVEDIDGGDNFADYCKDFFEMLGEEEYYDD